MSYYIDYCVFKKDGTWYSGLIQLFTKTEDETRSSLRKYLKAKYRNYSRHEVFKLVKI